MSEQDHTPAVVGVAVIRPHVMRLLFDDGVVRDLSYVPGEACDVLHGEHEPDHGLGFHDITVARQPV